MVICVRLFENPMDCSLPASSIHGNSPGKNTGVGCHAFPQGFFPTQASNPGLPHCKQILYYLSPQGSLRILEWVAHRFSRGPSWPRNGTGVSCIAGGFFTSWASREALLVKKKKKKKKSTWNSMWHGRHRLNPWVGKIPRGRKWQPTRVLAWKFPWTEEPAGLQSMGSQTAGLS